MTRVVQACQHFLTFEGIVTDSESPLQFRYNHAILVIIKDVHSTATGCKWVTFSCTTIMQHDEKKHIAGMGASGLNELIWYQV